MQESLAAVKQDEFGWVEKKYTNSKATGSHALKHPWIVTDKSLTNKGEVLFDGSDPDDSDFKSQPMASKSSDSSSNNSVEEVSNAEVH